MGKRTRQPAAEPAQRDRQTVNLELTAEAAQSIETFLARTPMFRNAMLAGVLKWFAQAPDPVKQVVLGIHAQGMEAAYYREAQQYFARLLGVIGPNDEAAGILHREPSPGLSQPEADPEPADTRTSRLHLSPPPASESGRHPAR